MSTEAAIVAPLNPARPDRMFYTGMAIAFLVTAILGFGPTYFYKPFHVSAPLSPLLHLHGVVGTAWLLLFLVQTSLVRKDRVDLHMRVGIVGAVLALVLVILGVIVSIRGVHRGKAADGMDPLGFMIFPFGQTLIFAGFVGLGLWKRNRVELHRRLMMLGTITLLTPAISRLVGERSALAAMLTFLYVVVAMIYDWRTRGRVHPAYIWGGAILFVAGPARAAFAHTDAWHVIARAIAGQGS
jgi:hypothetical protein